MTVLSGNVTAATADGQVVEFNIPEQRADLALIEFAEQVDRTLLFSFDETRSHRANRLQGRYTVVDGLERLLAGSGLSVSVGTRGQLQVVEARSTKGEQTVQDRKSLLGRIGAALASALIGSGAGTADADEGTSGAGGNQSAVLEEVVVTATKRGAVNVQELAMSARALTGDTLRRRGVEDFVDWARLVPGLTAEDQGPGEKRLVIRGVRAQGPATVGVYWDDAVITGSNTEDDGGGRNADIRLYDLERIEVLRGPQGTLYGANSFSGTIRYITNKPDPAGFSGALATEFSDTRFGDNSNKVNGHINIPVTSDFAIRAVGYYEDEGGFIDNVRLDIDDENEQETWGGRFAARLLATEDLTVDASVVIQRTDLGGKQRFFPQVGDLEHEVFVIDKFTDDLELYQLSAEYEMAYGTLTASSAFFNRDVFFRADSTPILQFFGVPLPFAIAVNDQLDLRETWSNELRFASSLDGPFQFVVGTFYSNKKKDFESNVISATPDGQPTGTEPDIFGRTSSFDIDQFAIFSEVTYDVTEKVTLLAGLRFFDFNQDSQSRETVPFFDPGANPPPDPDRSASESDINLKFSVSYRANANAMLYALVSEGFREGGTNSTGFGSQIIIPEEFESDSITNFELGAKTQWFANRLTVNASGYVIDWSNIQVEQQEPVAGFPFIGNAGEARITGLELEIFAQPAPGLELVLAGGYQNAELTEDQPPLSVDTVVGKDGDPIPFVPDFTGAVSIQYERPIYGSWLGWIRFDTTYTDDSQTQFNERVDFFNRQDSYAISDLRVGFENDNFGVEIFADNIFDKRADLTIIESVGDPKSIFTNRPRTIGIKISARR